MGKPADAHAAHRDHSDSEAAQRQQPVRLVANGDQALGFALGAVLDFGVEGIAVPEFKRIDGLHVVMTVEHQVRAAFATMADDHGLARCFMASGVETHAAQFFHEMVGCRDAGVVEGRVSGD